ncbi:MAG TPA: hypothetical protein VGD71_06405 [Kribbella sp.]
MRKQAESWRTGLTGLTTLFGAVLLVKGRDTVTSLVSPYPQVVVGLFGIALILLVIATMAAVRAASGVPDDECLLTGEDLREWSRGEIIGIGRRIFLARLLTLIGLAAVGVAVGIAWLAPNGHEVAPTVQVRSPTGPFCGVLVGMSDRGVILQRGGCTMSFR